MSNTMETKLYKTLKYFINDSCVKIFMLNSKIKDGVHEMELKGSIFKKFFDNFDFIFR